MNALRNQLYLANQLEHEIAEKGLRVLSNSEILSAPVVQGYKGKEVKLPPTNEIEVMFLAPHFCDVIIITSAYGHHFKIDNVSRIKERVGVACKRITKLKKEDGYKNFKMERKTHKIEPISKKITELLKDMGLDEQEIRKFSRRYFVKSASCMEVLKDTIVSSVNSAFKNELKDILEKKIASKIEDVENIFFVLGSLNISQLSFVLDNCEKLEEDIVERINKAGMPNEIKNHIQAMM